MNQSVIFPEEANESRTIAAQISDWSLFYSDYFGIKRIDRSTANMPRPVPAAREGFGQIVIIAQDLTIDHAFNVCKKKFKCFARTDHLDQAVTQNDRMPVHDYTVRIREDRIEADEEFANKSAFNLAIMKIAGMTLLERLVYELFYFRKTGSHLDITNRTLCTGSKTAGGEFLSVHLRKRDKCVSVGLYSKYYAHEDLRVREVLV